eukprot:s2524_g3.t2
MVDIETAPNCGSNKLTTAIQVGTQPRTGSFQWHVDHTVQLPGHMGARGAIMILFEFPPGTDDAGRPYPGRREKGFLPNNCQGIIQLELFKVAFRRRVMFALSTSLTTGRFKPTFNIHIKTKSRGGAAQHGYPDNDYFQRKPQLQVILLTHLHGDHCYGVFGVLSTAAIEGRKDPILIVGPQGIQDMVESTLRFSGGWVAEENFKIEYLEIPNIGVEGEDLVGPHGSGVLPKLIGPRGLGFHPERCRRAAAVPLGILALAGLKVQAVPLVHGMPDWGYVFTEPDRPGKLDAAKAQKLGIPRSPLMGRLKKGETVTLDDGSVVHPEEDTSDACSAIKPCHHANCVVHEATFEAAMEEDALKKGHSTPYTQTALLILLGRLEFSSVMAARFAVACEAFGSQRYCSYQDLKLF